MLGPKINSRIEQPDKFSGLRIDSRNVWTFVTVAVKTRQSEVFENRFALVLFGNDMIDLVSKERRRFRYSAVFAPLVCANYHRRAQFGSDFSNHAAFNCSNARALTSVIK